MNNINFAIQEYVTGSDIKRVRKTLQLTQKKFAELLGVSVKTLQRWDREGILKTNHPHRQALLHI